MSALSSQAARGGVWQRGLLLVHLWRRGFARAWFGNEALLVQSGSETCSCVHMRTDSDTRAETDTRSSDSDV